MYPSLRARRWSAVTPGDSAARGAHRGAGGTTDGRRRARRAWAARSAARRRSRRRASGDAHARSTPRPSATSARRQGRPPPCRPICRESLGRGAPRARRRAAPPPRPARHRTPTCNDPTTRRAGLDARALVLKVVGVRGFEPPAPCSQSRCATRLRHTPISAESLSFFFVKPSRRERMAVPTRWLPQEIRRLPRDFRGYQHHE